MTNLLPPDAPKRSPFVGFVLLVLFSALIYATLATGVVFTFGAGALALVSLLGPPLLIGFIAPFVVDRDRQEGYGFVLGRAFLAQFLLSMALLIGGLETAICIAIAAPFIAGLSAIGAGLGRYAQRRFHPDEDISARFEASFVLLPFAIAPFVLGQFAPVSSYTVRDEITINAPAETIWQHIESFDRVTEAERLWTVSHNLLGAITPVQSDLTGNIRHAEWSGGVHYEEHITAREAQAMRWDIVFPRDYHMPRFDVHVSPNSDALRLLRGRYLLRDTGAGTRLILETDYELETPLNAYLSLWGTLFLHDNHRSILHVLKRRAEAAS